jgi:alpha-D-ribose 1-methylphosphonate 5-triphosphate synthase subunit PhnG
MNEERFGRQIKGYLNWGLDLPEDRLARLKVAREQALARQRRPGLVLSLVPALAGGRGASWTATFGRIAVPVAIMAAALFGYQQWQDMQRAEAMAELDAKILSSDLPMDAFLDSGFDEWLQNNAE